MRFLILSVGIFSGLLWGLNDVFTKLVSNHFTLQTLLLVCIFSLLLAWFQDAISSAAILFSKTLYSPLRQKLKSSQPAWKWLCLAAFFAGPLGMVSGIAGIDLAGPVYAGTITSCYPIVTLIFAMVMLKERISAKRMAGVILAVLATICISIMGEHSNIKLVTLGIIFATIAMFGWGLESILLSIAYQKTKSDMALLLAIRQLFSSFFYLLILLLIGLFYFNFAHLFYEIVHFPKLLFACIITAFSSYMAYYYFIRFVGASLGTLFNATFIFWAAVFSDVLRIQTVPDAFWFMALLLVIGLYLAESSTQATHFYDHSKIVHKV